MKKKVAVITGISKGIGRAIGDKFESESIVVVGFSRTAPQGTRSNWVQGDVTSEEDRHRLRHEVMERYGRVDILVNNAGQGLLEPWETTTEHDLRSVFETNFFSMVEMTGLFLDDLRKTRGSIINVSSALGKMAMPCMGGYCATKFAVDGFSNSLRMEVASRGIHVLNLTIGALDTDFLGNCLGSKTCPPMPGIGSPERLATRVYRGYCRRKREITYPGWYRPYIWWARLFPSLNDYFTKKSWKL